MSETYDVVIVGGGTAGCVMAARLTEDLSRRVLLLEAGTDYFADGISKLPPQLSDARRVPMRGHLAEPDPRHDWGLTVRAADGTSIAIPQGRGVGGGSAINGTISLRGATADYREWSELGNPDWNWNAVLAAFRALEDDTATPASVHGRGGPWPIARAHEQEYGALHAAFVASCRAIGQPDAWDLNAPDAHGVGPAPMARYGTRRVSAAIAYLNPVRARSNLTVQSDVTVARVRFDGTRAAGVELADGTVIAAREVILCAGTLATPALLQRSGVGPQAVLEEAGVPVLADLPVGENLGDHFAVPVLAQPRPGVFDPDTFSLQTVLRTSSTAQPGALDMQVLNFGFLWASDGERGLAGEGGAVSGNVAGVACVNNKPRAVGRVRIDSPAAEAQPIVEPNYLADPVDRQVTREVVRLGWDVVTSEPLAGLLGQPLGLDAETVADDAALDAAIDHMVASAYHFTGTCRMGPVDDERSVVDQHGRVHGFEGLRVGDASVMPTVPAANSMLPTLMVAERLAAAARDGVLPGTVAATA